MSNDKRPSENRSIIRSILAQAVLASFAFGWAPSVEVTSAFAEEEVVDAVDDEQLASTACLEHLATDRLPAIRHAVANAARTRYLEAPARCRAVLLALASDPELEVSHVAQRGLASLPEVAS